MVGGVVAGASMVGGVIAGASMAGGVIAGASMAGASMAGASPVPVDALGDLALSDLEGFPHPAEASHSKHIRIAPYFTITDSSSQCTFTPDLSLLGFRA